VRLTIIGVVAASDWPVTGSRAIAWGGALAFAASLGFFLFSYAVTFADTADAAGRLWPIATNTALFSAFALHHSIFARAPVRHLVTRFVPGDLERSLYVWVASLLFVAVCALWMPVAGEVWRVDGWPRWAFRAASLVGLVLTARSAAAIDIWELAGVAQPKTQSPGPENIEFKTTGPYGLVRHPIYLGWLFLVFGVAHMTSTRFAFAVISSAYLVLAIPLEERSLRRTTGGKYDAYTRQVRWRMVPGIY